MRQFIYDYRPDVIILNSRYVIHPQTHTHTNAHALTHTCPCPCPYKYYAMSRFVALFLTDHTFYTIILHIINLMIHYIILYFFYFAYLLHHLYYLHFLRSGGQNSLTTAQTLTTEIVPEAAEMIRNRAK